MHIHKKILVGVATLAMPLATIAVVGGTTGVAFAKSSTPPNNPITCALTATVNFAAPGLSATGSVTTNKESATTVTNGSLSGASGCSGGSAPTPTITSKNTKCTGTNAPITGCAKGSYVTGSLAEFAAASSSGSLLKAVKKLDVTMQSVGYEFKDTAAGIAGDGGPACGTGSYPATGNKPENGFWITGSVGGPKQDKGQSVNILVCLGADTYTGPGTGNFNKDIGAAGVSILTATIDPSTSSIAVG